MGGSEDIFSKMEKKEPTIHFFVLARCWGFGFFLGVWGKGGGTGREGVYKERGWIKSSINKEPFKYFRNAVRMKVIKKRKTF